MQEGFHNSVDKTQQTKNISNNKLYIYKCVRGVEAQWSSGEGSELAVVECFY